MDYSRKWEQNDKLKHFLFTQSPDVFTFNGEAANSSASLAEPPTYDTAGNTEWYWSGNDTKEVIYILSNKDKTTGQY